MSKEAGIIDNTPILGVPQTSDEVITEPFSLDDEIPKIITDLSEISESLIPDSSPNNQSIEAQKDNLFALNTLPHMRLTQERLNSQSPTQPWREHSGLGFHFPVLNEFSGLGHQNLPLHK